MKVITVADIFTAFAHHTDEWHLTVCPLWVGKSGIALGHELKPVQFEVISREMWESGEVLYQLGTPI